MVGGVGLWLILKRGGGEGCVGPWAARGKMSLSARNGS